MRWDHNEEKKNTHTEGFYSIGYAPSPNLMSEIQNTELKGVMAGKTMKMEIIQQLFYHYFVKDIIFFLCMKHQKRAV